MWNFKSRQLQQITERNTSLEAELKIAHDELQLLRKVKVVADMPPTPVLFTPHAPFQRRRGDNGIVLLNIN